MPSQSKLKKLRYLVLATPVLLAACGDGWEMIRVDDMVPYGNTRTAGTGVAYVRAKMLPQKELKLEPAPAPAPVVAPAPAAPPPMSVPPAKAEEVFREGQSK
jgi:hypothetical protein